MKNSPGWRPKRLLRVILSLLGLLLGAALLGLLVYISRATPQQSGMLKAAGLSKPVQVQRDAHGVPTLRAETLTDLVYAQGFTHAQDRGWQLEQQRRVGAGRLAEAFGANAVDTDRFLRVLGVRRAAEAQWAWMQEQPASANSVAVLKAYAAGVNAGWRAQARPPEMLILGLQFEEWTPVDSLAWALMMAWDLGTNWNSELLRLRLAVQLPKADKTALQRIHELMPPYPGDQYPALADFPTLYAELKLAPEQLERMQAAAPQSGVEGAGSNNWAVAAARSKSGQPLLANDPHLGQKAPSLLYLNRLEIPGLKVAGASLPGLPMVLLGQNERLAWAFTNTGPDTQDLFIEELDGERIRTPEGWRLLTVHEEVIRVKGAADVKQIVRVGRHGPLISDAGPGRDLLGSPRHALALQWMALQPEQDSLGAFLQFNQAQDFAAFREAARAYHSPMQSMLVAVKDGGIHLLAPGRVPVRRADNDLHGLAPAPGWDARYDWQGVIPFDELPQRSTPAEGFLATANQKIVGPDYRPQLSHEWALPWRQRRIEQLLAARPVHSIQDLAAQQADVHSLGAAPLLSWFRAARSPHALAAAVQPLQAGFTGSMDKDAAAPALFWVWQRHLLVNLLADDLGESLFERALATRSFRDALEAIATQPNSPWCDRVGTPAVETCAEQSNAALTQALDELQGLLGADPARWRWGQLHLAKSEHVPFSRVAALRPLFELAVPVGGDTYTVNVSRVRLRPDWSGQRYISDHGPVLRALYDLSKPEASRFIIATGQSGLPWSAHYRDLLPRWAAVDYLPLWGDGRVKSTLELQP